jgi:hypothetical protein
MNLIYWLVVIVGCVVLSLIALLAFLLHAIHNLFTTDKTNAE